MAHTHAGRALTEQHRADQVSLTEAVVDLLRDMFLDVFRPAAMDETAAEFVKRALPVVLESRDFSRELAVTYLERFSAAEMRGLVDSSELPEAIADTSADALPSPGAVMASLHSSGAAVAKRKIAKGGTEAEATEAAAKAVSAKAMRLVADGGRAPLMAEVRHGRRGAIGYARVVDADPCPFCAMLASRGAVYRSDAFTGANDLFSGDNDFKVHDGCGCLLEPVYGKHATNLPAGSAELAREWAEIAAGRRDPFGYWRRYKESGTRPGDERASATPEGVASAPQYGRSRAERKPRKQIGDITDKAELEATLKGMYVRRAGLEAEVAELEQRGQSVREPGPAQAIAKQLDRLERQIRHAQRRLGTI